MIYIINLILYCAKKKNYEMCLEKSIPSVIYIIIIIISNTKPQGKYQ